MPTDPRGSRTSTAGLIHHQIQLMSSVLLGAALSSVIVAVITQMICSTVTSSQRCHLKLKIHVKSGDATFKQTVETWSDFTINVLLNSFMPLWLHMGDGRFQGSGHLEDVCVNLFGLLLQNTTHWEADRTEIYFRTILVAISPRSSCQQGFLFFFFLRPLSMACRRLSPPWIFTWLSLCVCRCPNFFFL